MKKILILFGLLFFASFASAGCANGDPRFCGNIQNFKVTDCDGTQISTLGVGEEFCVEFSLKNTGSETLAGAHFYTYMRHETHNVYPTGQYLPDNMLGINILPNKQISYVLGPHKFLDLAPPGNYNIHAVFRTSTQNSNFDKKETTIKFENPGAYESLSILTDSFYTDPSQCAEHDCATGETFKGFVEIKNNSPHDFEGKIRFGREGSNYFGNEIDSCVEEYTGEDARIGAGKTKLFSTPDCAVASPYNQLSLRLFYSSGEYRVMKFAWFFIFPEPLEPIIAYLNIYPDDIHYESGDDITISAKITASQPADLSPDPPSNMPSVPAGTKITFFIEDLEGNCSNFELETEALTTALAPGSSETLSATTQIPADCDELYRFRITPKAEEGGTLVQPFRYRGGVTDAGVLEFVCEVPSEEESGGGVCKACTQDAVSGKWECKAETGLPTTMKIVTFRANPDGLMKNKEIIPAPFIGSVLSNSPEEVSILMSQGPNLTCRFDYLDFAPDLSFVEVLALALIVSFGLFVFVGKKLD